MAINQYGGGKKKTAAEIKAYIIKHASAAPRLGITAENYRKRISYIRNQIRTYEATTGRTVAQSPTEWIYSVVRSAVRYGNDYRPTAQTEAVLSQTAYGSQAIARGKISTAAEWGTLSQLFIAVDAFLFGGATGAGGLRNNPYKFYDVFFGRPPTADELAQAARGEFTPPPESKKNVRQIIRDLLAWLDDVGARRRARKAWAGGAGEGYVGADGGY